MSDSIVLDYEATYNGDELPDPRALLIGVSGVVNESRYAATVNEDGYSAVIQEAVHPGAVVDETLYAAVVTVPAKPIVKVTEWPL